MTEESQRGPGSLTVKQRLLLKDLDHRFQEKLVHIQRYHRQTDLLKLYLAFAATIGAIAFSPSTKAILDSQMLIPRLGAEAAIFMFALFAWLLAQYIAFSIVDAWVLIFRNAARIGAIEKKLNEICGSEVLVWDSKVAPEFNTFPKVGELPLRFDILSTVAMLLLLTILAVVLTLMIFLLAKSYVIAFAAVVVAFALLNAYQFFHLARKFLPRLSSRTDELSRSILRP